MTKITQLPVASTISDTGVFVIVDEGTTKQLSWQTLRTSSLKGDTGPVGATGAQGPRGDTGTVATISVGTVEVSEDGTATVTASTSTVSSNITILDFVIPQGPKGDTGVVSWAALPESLVPENDVTLNIGSSQKRWNNLYLGASSIFLDRTVISSTVDSSTATITDVTLQTSVNEFTVEDGSQVTIGSVFSGLPGMNGVECTVTDIIGNRVLFSPAVSFEAGLTTPYSVTFVASGGLLIDGLPFGYDLPKATASSLGGVKVGEGVSVSADGTISVNTGTPYILTTATRTVLGGIKVGAGINLSTDGTISVTTGAFALQTATSVVLGGVKVGTGIDAAIDGTITLAPATASAVGGVKIGSGIEVSTSGTISVSTGLSLASSLTGSTLASNVTASSLVSVGVLSELTVGGITTIGQTKEKFLTVSSSSGIVSHDSSRGTIFVHTSPTSNFTANFTNVGTGTNEVVSFAILINQGSTPRIPSSVQINSAPQVLKWQGGITPTGNANKVDLINFTVFLTTGTNIVLGSLSSYG